MTSVVDKYYRKIAQNIGDPKNSIEIASLLIKSQEVDTKINEIKNDITNNSNSIKSNKENISRNINEIIKKVVLISKNITSIYDHKKRFEEIDEDR